MSKLGGSRKVKIFEKRKEILERSKRKRESEKNKINIKKIEEDEIQLGGRSD